jgi:kinesin family protein C2/C3
MRMLFSHSRTPVNQLTRLLEDSLGASSKTLLIVNCSPAPQSAGETKCSLEFAARARKVQLGPARRAAAGSGGEMCVPSSPQVAGGGAAGVAGGSPRAVRGIGIGTASAKMSSPLRQV